MRFQLGLVVLLFLPLLIKGQSTSPDVVFYSKGKMYVKYGSETDGTQSKATTLYIKGSAEFADGSGIIQNGRTELTGDFINGKDPGVQGNGADVGGEYAHLFKDPNTSSGVVAFVGKDNKQTIRRSTGLLANKGSQKKYNYIAFPTLHVDKTVTDINAADPRLVGFVAVDTSAAVLVNKLLSPLNASNVLGGNRFVVEGYYDDTITQKINLGQALIVSDTGSDLPGYSQVNLTYYKYNGTSDDDGAINPSTHEAATGPNTLRKEVNGKIWNYLTGFTPPFEEMGTDYLFYHVFMKPNKNSLTSNQGTILDPLYKMKAGYGYFMSMDVTNYGSKNIDDRWAALKIESANRAKGGFEFNRRLMRYHFTKINGNTITGGVFNLGSVDYLMGFSRFSPDMAGTKPGGWKGLGGWPDFGRDRIELLETEKFKTDAVTVTLEQGLNFLGNPFMAPISLNPLLGYDIKGNSLGTDLTAGVLDVSQYFGQDVNTSAKNETTKNVLRSKYWIVNNGLIRYDNSDKLYHMQVNYDYISTDGTTVTGGSADPADPGRNIIDPLQFLIAPMQMFIVQANKSFDISLSPTLRTFGTTRYLKSSPSSNLLSDFFVVEVASSADKIADRTAIVLRDNAKMTSDDNLDTPKNFSKSITVPSESDKIYPEEGSTFIYTKSSDGVNMLGNVVPLNIKELALYVTPPATQQTMSLNFYNLENLVSVQDVWLIDRYQNNKTVKLTPGTSYEYSSGPSDLKAVDENRFILRFFETKDILEEETTEITCYYNEPVLHISGLNEKDVNSDVLIYDMQGRLMGKTRVGKNDYPSMEYSKTLNLGTYIVKIAGNRTFTTKFVNLHN